MQEGGSFRLSEARVPCALAHVRDVAGRPGRLERTRTPTLASARRHPGCPLTAPRTAGSESAEETAQFVLCALDPLQDKSHPALARPDPLERLIPRSSPALQ